MPVDSSKLAVERYVTVFDKTTETCVAVYDILKPFHAALFRQVFGVEDPEDPMYECYPVGPQQAPLVNTLMDQPLVFDFNRNYYFLEASATGMEG